MRLLAVGRLRTGPERELFDRYAARLRPRLPHQSVHPAAQDGPARLRHAALDQDKRDAFDALLRDEESGLWVDQVNAAGRQRHGGHQGRGRDGRRGMPVGCWGRHEKSDCHCSRA